MKKRAAKLLTERRIETPIAALRAVMRGADIRSGKSFRDHDLRNVASSCTEHTAPSAVIACFRAFLSVRARAYEAFQSMCVQKL